MVNLRLDTKAGAFADRSGYQVIIPGNPGASRIYQRISSKDPAMHMPPVTFDRTLTDPQIELIRQWIEQGAKWQTHWAYEPPTRPELPAVTDGRWPRNAIDNFVLARLEKEGLKPSPETDKATLLRRVTLDLTGLPPTPAELESFLSDNSPTAYEERVEQLLKSPHYGERMAMQWLDLARYADTHGYHIDSLREMWHWRDWVINAYNNNMPFDQFTIEQLAGDLLPNATLQQQIASGFNRNHMINFEGGAIPEEYQNEYVIDRVDTTGTVWMGMAIGCARCHDHKYDPIKQKEYYRIYAFFNAIPEKGLDGSRGNARPFLLLPSSDQENQLNELKQMIAAKEKLLPEKPIAELGETWQKTRLSTLSQAPKDGLLANYEFDGFLADTSGNYQHAKVIKGQMAYNVGPIRRSGELDGESQVEFARTNAIDWNHPFSVGLWANPAQISIGRKDIGLLHKSSEGEDRRGFELFYEEVQKMPRFRRGSRLVVRLVHQWPGSTIQIRTQQPVMLEMWHNYAVTYTGSRKASGLKIYIDGKPVETETLQDNLTGTLQVADGLQIGNKKIASGFKGFIDDLRVYGRALTPAELDMLALHYPIRIILTDLADKPFLWVDLLKQEAALLEEPGVEKPKESKEDLELKALRTKVAEYFLTYDAPQEIKQAYVEWKELNAQKTALEEQVPSTMVMREAKKPRDSFVLTRGDYRNHGEKVQPAVLTWLAQMPKEVPLNRLGFAKWLVDPLHPLTARVAVNRYWQNYFGIGMVKTSEDFGSQGEMPSHPELLDWLASEFMRHGWSTKWLQRTIMQSATYLQSSQPQANAADLAQAQERDPDNRLLWRMNPHRLSFEQFRDTLLAISGELDNKMGGKGADLLGFRRSVYAQVDRQFLPSMFNVFDFASPDFHSSQRSETTSPQQALFALNSPYLADRARKIAAQIQDEASTPEARAIGAYQHVLRRDPTPTEVQAATQFLAAAMAESADDTLAAETKAWSYGYGEVDVKTGLVKSFQPLPHFTGAAWQGGSLWPDTSLGWAQLTAKGGHPGNDDKHAVIRRWTASTPGTISIKSEIAHQESSGDGVCCWIVSSRGGMLKSDSVYNKSKELEVDSLAVETGDVVDFVVDMGKNLDSDQFTWIPTIAAARGQSSGGASSSDQPRATWNSENDFPRVRLLPLEQLTQLLLISNELMFVD